MIINQVVSGGGSAPAHYIEKTVDANGVLQGGTRIIDLTGVKDVGAYQLAFAYNQNSNISGSVNLSSLEAVTGVDAMAECFELCPNITTVDMSGVKTITHGCLNMFASSGITSIDLSGLETIDGRRTCYGMCVQCSSLATADLRNLRSITGAGSSVQNYPAGAYMFSQSGLTSVRLDSLEEINGSTTSTGRGTCGYMFQNTSLTYIEFKSLHTVEGRGLESAFRNCYSLADVWFYALTSAGVGTNAFYNAFSVTSSSLVIHLPLAMTGTDLGTIGNNDATYQYDIITSLTGADGNTYTRKEKESTATATAWTYNNTLYYTSGVSNHTAGVNEPTVGTTIYSDAACTTAVTTVASIA